MIFSCKQRYRTQNKYCSNQYFMGRRVLLIPTLESRTTLNETLLSFTAHIDCFDLLCISVNGNLSPCILQFIADTKINAKIEVLLFETKKVIGPISHFNWIARKLANFLFPNDKVMLLADDDILSNELDINFYFSKVMTLDKMCLGIGRFRLFNELKVFQTTEELSLDVDEFISPKEFLDRNNLEGHRFTNMSGMIVPFKVFQDSIIFMKSLGSSGRRFEYIMATHRAVSFIYSPPYPCVWIRQHSLQAGRTLSFESYLHDEMIYCLWVWLNQSCSRTWFLGIGSGRTHFSFAHFLSLFKFLLILKIKKLLRIND